MTAVEFVAVAVAIMAASCLQSSIGFGMGMVAGPVIALVDTSLMPGTLIVLSVVLTALGVVADRTSLELTGTGWALAGRVPGSLMGAFLVALLPGRALALCVAVTILMAVVLSQRGWSPAPSRRNLVTAGLASGIFGTSAAIGGPPLALVWRDVEAARLRAMMSAFLLVGSLLALGSLLIAHAITRASFELAGYMMPAMLAGWAASRVANRYLSRPALTRVGMVTATCGAVVLVVTQVF
ncbi:MAG: hypothetical protein JWN22_564 [Nocardioides sp.]|nr:hypothetical protein [Nocardioides sp.]